LNTNITELGHFVSNPFEAKEINGFLALYNKSKPIINKYTQKECNVSVIVDFDCNKNVPWESDEMVGAAPKPVEFRGISKDSCEVFFI
jgi:hypothetical protein